jgi:hypothetical protein
LASTRLAIKESNTQQINEVKYKIPKLKSERKLQISAKVKEEGDKKEKY